MDPQSPLRVLVASPSFEGGVSNYVDILVRRSDPARVQFASVKIGKRSPTSPGWRRPFEYVADLWKFSRNLFQFRPEMVHLNPSLNWGSLPLNILFLLLVKAAARRPVLLFFRGWEDAIAQEMIAGSAKGRLLRRLLSYADYYLVLANQFKEQLIRAGFPETKIGVTSVMVDTARFSGLSSDSTRLADGEQSFRVLFLSRLVPAKGVWILMDALHWWQQRHPSDPIHLTMAGDGPEKEKLDAYIAEKNLQHLVDLPGYLRGEEKSRVYQQSDLFVFPSSHPEGFPNVALEALAAGLPMIYTPIGALREVLAPENGIRLDENGLTGEVLGQSMWELYQDKSRRECMVSANRKLAKEKYDVSIVCANMAGIYQQVLNGKRH